jgi:putative membrane protein
MLERTPATDGGSVEWTIIAVNFLYATLGVLLMYVSYRLIDMLIPQVDFNEELKRGNIAVAIFIGALFLSIAMIIGGALN